ncbi:MAG: sulfur carrier protein ThiS [Planctomycetota bacterium]|nr:sulfur carrier protein ThiS [Planctomycetota bacterium]
MITIELNGKPQTLPRDSTVSDLLGILGSDGRHVAVVVNETIVRPESRASHRLHEGDRVDILVFAGGG